MITLIKQFIRYFVVGGTAAVTEWVIFLLCELIGFHYLLATTVSFVVATYVNYIMGRTFAFRKESNGSVKEALMVYLVSLVGLLINLELMYLFVSGFEWNELISKLFSTGIAFFWNFFSRKCLIYRK